MFPELKLTVVVLTNSDYADPVAFVDVILKTLEAPSSMSRVNGVRRMVTRPN